jgi:AraC-like DNA-binding protein
MNTQDRIDQIIVELHANELTMQEIAEEFGVSTSYIYEVNQGKYGRIPNYSYPVRVSSAKRKEKYTDMEVWFEDCYEVKL